MYLRGDAAGRPGAHLAEVVGLDQRGQRAGLAVVEADVELRPLARWCV